ncbi:lipopolysaccharide-induced tumor necrosis factor-alpha factor homolog isoform X1 [Malaya genurostris]|uniref:lipopolysaccharide-induced tumor necrosis factor-alpha factor homolog isoform X1 n=2 Tax=Malaya genurostris TaxID=325434 RepID=UPI0026F3964B|nr:lipopolysaccharide-induced tumor necrosis factor-alpha factor homolog isoform X1 [Malaya genurostris]
MFLVQRISISKDIILTRYSALTFPEQIIGNILFCEHVALRMSKDAPPAYGFVPPPSAPPSYAQAVGGVPPASPYTANIPQPTGASIITTVVPVGPQTTHMICPSCHAEINTQTTTSPGLIAYVSGFLIALFGCWLGCCLIPCCIDECMDVHHSCPHCNAYLGRHRR